MTNFERKPIEQHHAIELIKKSVANLIVPPLAPLLSAVLDIKAGIANERTGITGKMNEVKIEGYCAATRLMLPSAEKLSRNKGDYFQRINKQ